MAGALPGMMPTSSSYLCTECNRLLRNPVQAYCGHRYCRSCIDIKTARALAQPCQGCMHDGETTLVKEGEIFPDRATRREMQQYNASCHNAACPWKGPYTLYVESHANECPYEEIVCDKPFCKMKFHRQDMEHHETVECFKKGITLEWIQYFEKEKYGGVLVWKITDFHRKRQDAISGKCLSILSPCFYTNRNGYKICAQIYLNGVGERKGIDVSLFFVIMKGPSDAHLKWPFRHDFTLMWLNQHCKRHVIYEFKPNQTPSLFKRPTKDMNIASGCPLFMPLSQLDSSRCGYIKDDAAIIRIYVNISDNS